MILRTLALGLLLASLSGCAGPLAARNGTASAASAAVVAAAKTASERGALLYAFDRAAWLGSDAFQADAIRLGDVQPLGYLVVPGKENALDFVVYGVAGGRGPLQIGRYPVVGDKAVGGNLGILPLSEAEARMIAARNVAAAAVTAQGLAACGEGAFNTIVLPPAADGSVVVYLLTPMVTNGSYPLGRHYRVDISADATVAGWRQFGATCDSVTWDPADAELAKRMHYLTAPSQAVYPNEIHSFIGHHVPFSLGIVTGKLAWPIQGGVIADPVVVPSEMINTGVE